MGGEPDAVTALMAALAKRGRVGRELAVRLDLVRATGVRRAARRWRQDVRTTRAAAQREPPHPFAEIWTEAARELGASVRDLGGGFLEIGGGASRTRVWNHWTPLDDIVTARLALEKDAVHLLLAEAGLQVPPHRAFSRGELAAAAEHVSASPGRYVVKPVGASGGGGVTSGVETRAQLIRAAVRAGRLDERILVERHVAGDVYRLLLLDGELVGAVRRRPPSVLGDGRSTIETLIAGENRRRAAAPQAGPAQLLRVDLDCVLALERQALSLDTVPRAGARVEVKGVVSQNAPGDNETVHELSDELVAEARRAAAAVGVRLAGIDVVATDVDRPLRSSGGTILEVNATPGLHYHYQVREPERAVRVAVPILRALLAPRGRSAR